MENAVWNENTYYNAKAEGVKYSFDYASKVVFSAMAKVNYNVGGRGLLFLNYSASMNNVI